MKAVDFDDYVINAISSNRTNAYKKIFNYNKPKKYI